MISPSNCSHNWTAKTRKKEAFLVHTRSICVYFLASITYVEIIVGKQCNGCMYVPIRERKQQPHTGSGHCLNIRSVSRGGSGAYPGVRVMHHKNITARRYVFSYAFIFFFLICYCDDFLGDKPLLDGLSLESCNDWRTLISVKSRSWLSEFIWELSLLPGVN